MSSNHPSNQSRGYINTLAQSGTTPLPILQGKGSDINNSKALKGRAKRKVITQKMILSLIDVVGKNRTPDEKRGYWNTYHCQNKVFSSEGRIYGKYCKNRFCTLCSCIRKADIMNRYLPTIRTWPRPTFVTLTIKAVSAGKLRYYVTHMMRAFRIINHRYRKRHQRDRGVKLVGVKSLECNFNPAKKTYNPHFHFIVPDKATAEILVKEWLSLWTKKFTLRICQNISPVFNHERALIETIKYGSKIFTEPNPNESKKTITNAKIHAAALDNIFKAFKGFRIFERFGFNLPKAEDLLAPATTITSKCEEWSFEPEAFDWINKNNGKKLTDFNPSWQLIELLQNHIDTDLK